MLYLPTKDFSQLLCSVCNSNCFSFESLWSHVSASDSIQLIFFSYFFHKIKNELKVQRFIRSDLLLFRTSWERKGKQDQVCNEICFAFSLKMAFCHKSNFVSIRIDSSQEFSKHVKHFWLIIFIEVLSMHTFCQL